MVFSEFTHVLEAKVLNINDRTGPEKEDELRDLLQGDELPDAGDFDDTGDPVPDPDDFEESAAKRSGNDDSFDIKTELFDWAEALVITLSVIVLIFVLFVRMIGVTGTSMVPTLKDGDQLLVSHMFYNEPQRGDIVVLTKESFLPKPLVKRIVAVGGQTIDIDPINHTVTVDGEVLYEPYINEATATSGDMIFPLEVPEGCVFVMGDNRNYSSDSRDSRLGIVDERYILGKVLFRVFPFRNFGFIE